MARIENANSLMRSEGQSIKDAIRNRKRSVMAKAAIKVKRSMMKIVHLEAGLFL